MAISDSKKVDYLWKKLGYGAAKTDTNARKKAPNEAIVSPLLIRGDRMWAESGFIPTVKPSADYTRNGETIVTIYDDANGNTVETTEDGTSTPKRTWLSNVIDWIPPEFGSTYQVKVYIDNPSAANPESTGTQIFATGSGNDDEWFFDYQSGVLHFIGENLPSQLTGSKKVYISGAQYVGVFGQDPTLSAQTIFANVITSDTMTTGTLTANAINTTEVTAQTINTTTINANTLILDIPLGANSGGTGLNGFTPYGVLYASNTSALTFAIGSSGQLLQLDITGTPVFDDLNGGEYS